MATGGQTTARGLLTPAKLEAAAASGPNRTWYARGVSDFTDLAKSGKVAMSEMPESGTVARNAVRGTGALVGAIAGGGLTIPGAAGAVVGGLAPRAMGAALMSRPVQAYLRNQLATPGGVGSRIAGAAGVEGISSTRAQALEKANSVLGPTVMKELRTSSTFRQPFAAWLKAKETGDRVDDATHALANALATKAKRPDLEQRIYAELLSEQ